MSTTKFDTKTRAALWRANDQKCFFCSELISFTDLEIDHIVPERTTLEELEDFRRRTPLPSGFDLNEMTNLVPAHGSCNQRKGGSLMDDATVLFYLQLWAKKQQRIQREVGSLKKAAERDKHLIAISTLIESGEISKQEVLQFVSKVRPTANLKPTNPMVVTFGANVADLIVSGVLPESAGHEYVTVSDWMEKDLLYRVSDSLPILAHQSEASARNGETLSVRIAFWNLDLDRFDQLEIPNWSILEISEFSELYDESPADLLAKAVVKAHGSIVSDPWDTVFGIGRCPRCGSTKLTRSTSIDHAHDETYYTIGCSECGWGEWTQ